METDRIVVVVDGQESKNLEEDQDVQRAAGFQRDRWGDEKKKKKKKKEKEKEKAWLFFGPGKNDGNGAEEENRRDFSSLFSV